MKITFELYYHTCWGELLMLSGDVEPLGAGDESRAVVMDYRGGDLWSATIEVPASPPSCAYR